MKQLPSTVKPYKKTPVFTYETTPKALLNNHCTKEGTWGLIHVLEGTLKYTIQDEEVHILSSEKDGVVEPTILHHVTPEEGTRFYVEFHR